MRHLIDTVNALVDRQVGFRSISESIDTTTPGGKLIFHIFGALAEFERELIRERTNAGLTAARARGRVGGRPSVMTKAKTDEARRMYDSGAYTWEEIAEMVGVSRMTVYRHVVKSQDDAHRRGAGTIALWRFPGGDRAGLARSWCHLSRADLDLVDRRRSDRTRLGFAVQLVTVRAIGAFLSEPSDVPDVVARSVAEQINVSDVGVLAGYGSLALRLPGRGSARPSH